MPTIRQIAREGEQIAPVIPLPTALPEEYEPPAWREERDEASYALASSHVFVESIATENVCGECGAHRDYHATPIVPAEIPTRECYCPDDCACHHSWRETICGCTAHDDAPNIVSAEIPEAVAEPGIPYNAVTGANYTGKNVLRLIMAEAENGYGAGGWAGFGQWRTLDRTVRKGEHGTLLIRMGEDKNTGKVRPFSARVFHFDQTTELVAAE